MMQKDEMVTKLKEIQLSLGAIEKALEETLGGNTLVKRQKPLFRTDFSLPNNQYIEEANKKDTIVLHHTAGTSVQGVYQHWINTPARVATAFVIDRAGTIFKFFDPRYWAYHIGGVDNIKERSSIGIELVNVGPLIYRDGLYYWWPDDFKTPYTQPRSNIYEGASLWRGYKYWEHYTAAQYDALNALIPWLLQEFKIPNVNVMGHSELRDDKTDPSPAFDWSKVKG
jgi:N-acetylmuramoyl-L-alanine amidase